MKIYEKREADATKKLLHKISMLEKIIQGEVIYSGELPRSVSQFIAWTDEEHNLAEVSRGFYYRKSDDIDSEAERQRHLIDSLLEKINQPVRKKKEERKETIAGLQRDIAELKRKIAGLSSELSRSDAECESLRALIMANEAASACKKPPAKKPKNRF